MNDAMNDKLREILTQIQEGTPKAYEALSAEINALGWKYVFGAVVLGVVVSVTATMTALAIRKGDREGWDDRRISGVVFPAFIFVMAAMFFSVCSGQALNHFLSPNLVLIERLVK